MTAVALMTAAMERVSRLLEADGSDTINKKSLGLNEEDFLTFAALGEHDSDVNKKAIRIAYDLENLVERWLLQEKENKKGVTCSGFLSVKAYLKLDPDFRSIRKRIGKLSSRCSEEPAVALEQSVPVVNVRNSYELKMPVNEETIGLEDHIIQMRESCIGAEEPQVIAITGISGVGKTTLAHKFFNDPEIRKDFQHFASVCFSGYNDRDEIDLLRFILVQLNSSKNEVSSMNIEQLRDGILSFLNDGRCVLLFDDLWDINILLKMFNDTGMEMSGNRGSVIIITTGDEIVEFALEKGRIELGLLTDEQTTELFLKKSGMLKTHSRRDLYKNASFPNTMTMILSLCRGLPSLIIRVADILKEKKLEDWHKVVYEIQLTEEIEGTRLWGDIALSYDHLEPMLKLCFLYTGLFPPNQPIPVEKVFLIWMAEGFVSRGSDVENCFGELESSKLARNVGRGQIWQLKDWVSSWQLQDMGRKLCVMKGKAEGFFGIADAKNGSTGKSIEGRAAVYLNTHVNGFNISSYIHVGMIKHIRALLFFSDTDAPLVSQWSADFAKLENFKSTRVLYFSGFDFRENKLSIGARKLFHLRYLGFERCYLEEFPLSFCNFPYLETLDLRVNTKMIIPNGISKMTNLKHLYLPVAYECKTEKKLKLDGLINLELLENFNVGICEVDDIPHFESLEFLTVISDGEDNDLTKLIGYVPQSLKTSSFSVKGFECYSKDRNDTLLNLLQCRNIHNLYLEGFIKQMPKDLVISQNFKEVVFDGTALREDPVPTLGEIRNLEKLVLCNDAIKVEKISCCVSSFPKLKILEISNLRSLQSWVLDDESMPDLFNLTVKQCHKLVTLPNELMRKRRLCRLNIGFMSQEFNQNVSDMGLERKVRDNIDYRISEYSVW